MNNKKIISDCNGKPKDFWKALKSIGLSDIYGECIVGAITTNEIVTYATKSVLTSFKIS